MKKIFAVFLLIFILAPFEVLAEPTRMIGDVCKNNSECLSGDCEESSLKDDSGKYISYCDCQEFSSPIGFLNANSPTCRQRWGEAPGGKGWACKNGGKESHGVDYCVDIATDKIAPTIAMTSGDIIDAVLNPAGSSAGTISEVQGIVSKPKLKITIPGLEFSDPVKYEENGSQYYLIPFLGQYIKTIYKYAIIIAAVFAVVMIVNKGFEYVMSGGTSEKISQANKRLVQILIGLFIALTSYIILWTINPALVKFDNLKVRYVQRIELPIDVESGEFVNQTESFDPNIKLNSNVPFFAQCYGLGTKIGWAGVPYGSGTVCEQGCGITSVAMILKYYQDYLSDDFKTKANPGDVAKWISSNGAKKDKIIGTSYPTMTSVINGYGLKAELLYKIDKANEKLLQNKPILVHVRNKNKARDAKLSKEEKIKNSSCRFTGGGHYIVLTGYDQNTKTYTINDPGKNNPPPERRSATADYLINNCLVSGFLYIHP